MALSFPDRDVALRDFDAGPPEARDHLRVAGVVALVGPEVENSHAPTSGGRLRHELDPLSLVDPLLVLGRDQLGDQPERDELDADHDEQHAERQKRPRTDPLTPDLQHGQVQEEDEADCTHEQAEAAEEVQAAGAGSAP